MFKSGIPTPPLPTGRAPTGPGPGLVPASPGPPAATVIWKLSFSATTGRVRGHGGVCGGPESREVPREVPGTNSENTIFHHFLTRNFYFRHPHPHPTPSLVATMYVVFRHTYISAQRESEDKLSMWTYQKKQLYRLVASRLRRFELRTYGRHITADTLQNDDERHPLREVFIYNIRSLASEITQN